MGGCFWEEVEKAGPGWEMMEASETRRPSVKEMREREKPRFGSGSVAREGEIKVPSFPAASSGLWPTPPTVICVFVYVFYPQNSQLYEFLDLKHAPKCTNKIPRDHHHHTPQ